MIMRNLGTSSIVVAAFVGPGTVLTCAAAGVSFSYSLAWVLVVSTLAVFVLQTFTAGTGILAGKGLGEAIRGVSENRLFRIPLFVLVVLGLWVGSAAFETGNLVGASAGLEILLGTPFDSRWWTVPSVIIVSAILTLDLRTIRNALTMLVAAMSLFFISAAVMAPVDWMGAFQGIVVPSIPDGSIVTVTALVGTTVVTYNLFLHASATKLLWEGKPTEESWRRERLGMMIFLPLGGLVSVAVLIAGASLHDGSFEIVAIQGFVALLEPVAGDAARYLFGLGLFAAGITSAITAPLAVAIGISELFAWTGHDFKRHFRFLWISVLAAGTAFSLAGFSPLHIIIAAQAANGFLLPLMAGVLVYVTAKQEEVLLPRHYLVTGVVITLFCAFLGGRTLFWVWTQVAG